MSKEINICDYDLLDTFQDPIAVINNTGEIIKVNNAWKKFSSDNSGREEFTCKGVNYFSVCEGVVGMERETAVATLHGVKKVLTGEKDVFEIEYPCDSPTEKRWFLLKAVVLEREEKLCLLSHINITRRKLAELDVEKKNILLMDLNRKLNTTVYRLAHDIQSPLNSIKGVISLNKENIITIEQTIELIETSVKNLSGFLEDTVRQAMAPSDGNLTEVDFEKLLKEIIASVKYLKSDISINFFIEGEEIFFSYILELRTIFSNIISNSIKYSDPEKKSREITIRIINSAASVIISIQDNGIGIDQKNLKKVFDFKFQEDKRSDGFGIGLYLVKHSVEKLNGTFSVKSKSGAGTEFVFEIPNMKDRIKTKS